MKFLINRTIWQKIIIAFFLVIMLFSVVAKPVQAMSADILLKPITGLFVGLADALEGVMQKIILDENESLIKVVYDKPAWWQTVLVIGLIVIGAIVAIALSYFTGGASAAIYLGFMIGVGVIAINLGCGVIYGEDVISVIKDMLSDIIYFPQFALSPYEIFDNKITVLDVNFFNPKDNQVTGTDIVILEEMVDLGRGEPTEFGFLFRGNDIDNAFGGNEPQEVEMTEEDEALVHRNMVLIEYIYRGIPIRKYIWQEDDKWFSALCTDTIVEDTGERWFSLWYPCRIEQPILHELKSPARELRTYIAGWYKTLRNLALVALLSILVYIGIRILLTSVASDKAKYQKMLVDWVVALSLLFVMHYIMSFSVYIVDKIRDMIDAIHVDVEVKDEAIRKANEINERYGYDNGDNEIIVGEVVGIVQLSGQSSNDQVTKMVKSAYATMVDSGNSKLSGLFFKDGTLSTRAESKDDANVMIWPLHNYMELARFEYQLLREDGTENVSMYGYGLIYVILVIYTIIFLFTYMKRVVYMAFLTVIAPLVAVTYPIDKMNDGKAQAFDRWFKEYIFNLLIQPLHLILYSVLISSAMNFASDNLVYVVIALGFFVPAEKMLRRFFGFEKAQTPGVFGGPAGSALMFSGLNRLMHHGPPKGGLGPGRGEKSKEDEEESKAPRTQKIDETQGFLGGGNDDDNANNSDEETPLTGLRRNVNPFNNNQNENELDNENNNQLSNVDWGIAPGTYDLSAGQGNYNQSADTFTLSYSLPQSERTQQRGQQPQQVQQRTNQPITQARTRTGRTNGNRKSPGRKRKALRRAATTFGNGVRNRYIAKKEQKGGLLRRGLRLAGGVATATTLTAAAGIGAIVSGEPGKNVDKIVAAGIGGYKLGSNIADSGAKKVNDYKNLGKDAIKDAKKGYHGSDYGTKEQEKYLEEFKKNEKNLNALEDRLNVDRKTAKEIMETHAQDYLNNDITNMDDFAAVYRLEHDENMGRKKAIATRHYAVERLNGQKVKDMDPEKKEKYDNMFKQEFINEGQSEAQATNTVDDLYNAVNKFHKYKK